MRRGIAVVFVVLALSLHGGIALVRCRVQEPARVQCSVSKRSHGSSGASGDARAVRASGGGLHLDLRRGFAFGAGAVELSAGSPCRCAVLGHGWLQRDQLSVACGILPRLEVPRDHA